MTLASNDAEKTGLDTTYVKAKEFTLGSRVYPTAKITIRFEIKDGGGGNAYGKIYYNEIAIGAEWQQSGVVYTGKQETFTFTNLKMGDRIQVYAKADSGSAWWIQNFRILGEASDFINTVE